MFLIKRAGAGSGFSSGKGEVEVEVSPTPASPVSNNEETLETNPVSASSENENFLDHEQEQEGQLVEVETVAKLEPVSTEIAGEAEAQPNHQPEADAPNATEQLPNLPVEPSVLEVSILTPVEAVDLMDNSNEIEVAAHNYEPGREPEVKNAGVVEVNQSESGAVTSLEPGPQWLLKPYLIRGSLTLIIGATGSGKTSLALHLGMKLSKFSSEQVVYFATQSSLPYLENQMVKWEAYLKQYFGTDPAYNPAGTLKLTAWNSTTQLSDVVGSDGVEVYQQTAKGPVVIVDLTTSQLLQIQSQLLASWLQLGQARATAKYTSLLVAQDGKYTSTEYTSGTEYTKPASSLTPLSSSKYTNSAEYTGEPVKYTEHGDSIPNPSNALPGLVVLVNQTIVDAKPLLFADLYEQADTIIEVSKLAPPYYGKSKKGSRAKHWGANLSKLKSNPNQKASQDQEAEGEWQLELWCSKQRLAAPFKPVFFYWVSYPFNKSEGENEGIEQGLLIDGELDLVDLSYTEFDGESPYDEFAFEGEPEPNPDPVVGRPDLLSQVFPMATASTIAPPSSSPIPFSLDMESPLASKERKSTNLSTVADPGILSEWEKKVIGVLSEPQTLKTGKRSSELVELFGVTKAYIFKVVNSLLEKGLVEKEEGRGSPFRLTAVGQSLAAQLNPEPWKEIAPALAAE